MTNSVNLDRRTALKGVALIPLATVPLRSSPVAIDPSLVLWDAYETQEQIEMVASDCLDLAEAELPSGKYKFKYGKVSNHEELDECRKAWQGFNNARGTQKDIDEEFAKYHKGLDQVIAKRETAKEALNIDALEADYNRQLEKGRQYLNDYFSSTPTTPEGLAKMVENHFVFDASKYEKAKERFLADLPEMLRGLS
ncbi:hypothetical protein NBZ79_00540 [Sneathiella marina]|uniref:Uncharacterized protein n=1 Tax=Sneathiella marina TaxID=2950108 RepID=A0ABY4W3C5_9PROT|nr:hypothetical protein [Sneathiella marina]USG61462.1 hypothetical protein NBZ79_00540 [Sneathiella marina]